MATLYEIGQALRNADAAGDIEAAKRLAQAYRDLQTGSARREEAAPEPEKSFATQMYEAGKRGVASTVNAAELFGAETPEEISSLVAENVKAQPAPTAIQKKMAEEIKPYQQEYAESSGIGAVLPALSMAGKRAQQFIAEPKEFALSSAENLPNSVPGIAGGLLGGTVGSVVPVFGTVVGGVAGGAAAGYPIEKGSSIRDQVIQLAQEKGIDPTDAEKLRPLVKEHLDDIMTKAQKKGLGTAGVDAAVNVLTLGVAGAGERILKKQADDLVDAAQKGKISKSDYDDKLKEIQDKQDERNTLAAKTLRGAGIMGGEMGGEALSEYAGQKYAYGQADPLSVIDEAILGLGQGAGMSASRGLIEKAAGVATNNEVNDALEKARAFYPTEETDKDYIDGEVIDRTAHDMQQEEELQKAQADIRDVQDKQEEERWAQQQRGTIVPPSEFQMPYDGEQKQAEIVNQDENIGTTAAAAATTPQAATPQAQPTVALHDIPLAGEQSKIVDYGGRKIVMADVNGVQVPFYLSTGEAGKKNVEAGKWYPIFGIGERGWLNKGTQKEINDFYGSPELKAVAEQLNSQIGDIREASHPEIELRPMYQQESDKQALSFINSVFDTAPAARHDAEGARQALDANMQSIKDKLAKQAQGAPEPVAAPEIRQEHIDAATKLAKIGRAHV